MSYTREPFEPVLGAAAKRAISDKLPPDMAVGAVEFITGPLLDNPYRVGKELQEPLDGIYSARLMREWRILYEITTSRSPARYTSSTSDTVPMPTIGDSARADHGATIHRRAPTQNDSFRCGENLRVCAGRRHDHVSWAAGCRIWT